MMNLEEMTVTEAVRMAKEISGKTGKQIADQMGVSRGVITRYLKKDDDYSPRMGMIPDMCQTLENELLFQWLEVRIRENRERRREKMLLHVAKMEKALRGIHLLLTTEEGMSAEDEEEAHDLLTKIDREGQRLNLLLHRARHHSDQAEKRRAEVRRTRRSKSRV